MLDLFMCLCVCARNDWHAVESRHTSVKLLCQQQRTTIGIRACMNENTIVETVHRTKYPLSSQHARMCRFVWSCLQGRRSRLEQLLAKQEVYTWPPLSTCSRPSSVMGLKTQYA